ncbi:MAG: hypothetical protein ACKO3P_24140 [Planctomycetaceae bacterium]
MKHLHLGGHFGCVNRYFVAEHVVPLWTEANRTRKPREQVVAGLVEATASDFAGDASGSVARDA